MKNDSYFGGLITVIHFYLSLIYGWNFYVDAVLPFCPIVGMKHGVDPAFAMYMLNVLAFSMLVYVVSRPFVHLVERFIERVFTAIENRRGSNPWLRPSN